jgi:hypothetical protein
MYIAEYDFVFMAASSNKDKAQHRQYDVHTEYQKHHETTR